MTISNDIPTQDSLNGHGFSQKLTPSSDGIEYESKSQTVRMHDINDEKAY